MSNFSGYYYQLPVSVGDYSYFWAIDRLQWYRDVPIDGWTASVQPADPTCTLITSETAVFNDVGTGLWDMPEGAKLVFVYLIAGGSGGGGGGTGGPYGGGGGAGGAYAEVVIPASLLRGYQLYWGVGDGGAGGAADNDGSAGGDSYFAKYDGTTYTYLALAFAGGRGIAAGLGGDATGGRVNFPVPAATGGDGGTFSNGGLPIGVLTRSSGGSGGGGGGGNGYSGGDGDVSIFRAFYPAAGGDGSGDNNGADGEDQADDDIVGGGGGGGGAQLGNGGNGGIPGGGGGGGGAIDSGGAGAGGNGARGRVVLVVVF